MSLPTGNPIGSRKARPGKLIKWQAEITEDRPNQLIAWRTLPGSQVDHMGKVEFEPATGGRGTVVRAEIKYRSPGGLLAERWQKCSAVNRGRNCTTPFATSGSSWRRASIPTTVGQPAGRQMSTSQKFDDPMPEPIPTREPAFAS